MLDELKTASKIVGIKQSIKAIQAGTVKKAFVAKDADPRIVDPIIQSCNDSAIQIEYVDEMKELGKACGIDVGAAVVVIV